MKSIFYFYDVHIQEKITMKVEWTEKIWFWSMVLTTTGQWNPWIMNRAPTSSYNTTLLNRLYGVWHLWLFTWYFRFQNKCNRSKFVAVSRWISGFYIKQIYKECHWTPFYPPITLRGREYYFPVVRMFLHAFSPKQLAETSVHRATHPTVTKMTIVKLCFNVLLHIFAKQFENEYSLWESNSNCKIDFICLGNVQLNA